MRNKRKIRKRKANLVVPIGVKSVKTVEKKKDSRPRIVVLSVGINEKNLWLARAFGNCIFL